jgi:hypothetical protein
MNKWIFLLTIVSFLTTSCCNKNIFSDQLEETEKIDIDQLAKKILGQKPEIIPNEEATLHLCIIRNAALDLRFMVLDNKGNIIYPVKRMRGTVKWHNNSQLAVQIDPGHIGRSEASSSAFQIIDLISKKKQEKI